MVSVIDPETRIGVVTLSVASLERSLDYYQGTIGLRLIDRGGDEALLGVGGLGLLRLRELPGARVVRRATGLYHFALRVPTRRDLARVLVQLAETRTPISGASDHLVSEALYLSDPDGHGIEIYRDRPRDAWYDENGNFHMATIALNIDDVLAELGPNPVAWQGMPDGTDMGHIHLQVADVVAAEHFYTDVLGFERMTTYPGASFVSAGGYHHHLGLNNWAGRGVPAPPENAARLLSFELRLPTQAALEAVRERVHAAGIMAQARAEGLVVRDPSYNTVLLIAGQ